MNAPPAQDIRPSPIAGQWYPGNAKQLKDSIDGMLPHATEHPIEGQVIGLIAPHAGHRYSGHIAAQAFSCVMQRSYQRVVIISPMHHPYAAPLLTSAHEAYQTPLGTVPLDTDFIARLRELVQMQAVRDDPEHAVEIELPFLQQALSGSFNLVPLMLRDQTYRAAENLGNALATAISDSDSTLLVASSDLSHFYSDEQARQLDEYMLEQIGSFDPQGVIQAEQKEKAYACGRGAIAAVLIAARQLGAVNTTIVGYGTSADVSGDHSRVVGYGAAVITT